MHRLLRPAALVVFLLVVGLGLVSLDQVEGLRQAGLTQDQILKNLVPVPPEAGNKKDGRNEFDWYRLRNPQTGEVPRGIRIRELRYADRIAFNEAIKSTPPRTISTQDWNERGPVNIGGRTRALKVDITDSDRILAGGVTGGMWLSEDAGDTWTRTTGRGQIPMVACVAQDPRDGHTDTWYYGTGEFTGSGSRSINSRVPKWVGNGIFKSTDGGESWELLESTISSIAGEANPYDVVFRVTVDPLDMDNDVVLAAAFAGVYRSEDGGESWELVLGIPAELLGNNTAWTDIATTTDGVHYATLSSGINGNGQAIFRSTDGGENWTNITPDSFPNTNHRITIGIAPSDETKVFFLAMTPGYGFNGSGEYHSLWYLDDSGDDPVWEERTSGIPDLSDQSQLGFAGRYRSQGGYDMVVAVHPENINSVYIGGIVLFRSDNGFTDANSDAYWIGGYNRHYGNLPSENPYDINYPGSHADIHQIAFDPNNADIMYCSHDGGISKTTNSLAMDEVNNPFPWEYIEGYITTQFYWIGIDPLEEESPTIVGGMQDNGTWVGMVDDATTPWQNVWGGDGMACAIGDGGQPGYRAFYASTQYGGSIIQGIVDESGEFVDGYYCQPSAGNFRWWITPFHLDPSDWRAFYMADEDNLWRNPDAVDDPDDWESIPGTNVPGSRSITGFGVSTDPERIIYYASVDVAESNPDPTQIFRVDNALGGATVTDVSDPDFPGGGWVHCIAVDPTDADKTIVVFTNYEVRSLFYTSDGGTTWTDVGGNLEENPDGSGDGPSCFWAEIVYVEGQPFYLVGTTTGLYSSQVLDGEDTEWVLEGEDVIGNTWVTSIDARQTDGFVGIGTHGSGVFSGTIELTGVDGGSQPERPSEFALSPAFPNPFNASTTVEVKLPATSDLRVAVYNMVGREVALLADGSREAGRHLLHFRADGLASGSYIIRAEADGRMLTQKAVLVK
ncbi:T9SS type A sorting domain-containing protein [bacterium]|nr:T9SS type A sorting domain-containing protein [bacterium]